MGELFIMNYDNEKIEKVQSFLRDNAGSQLHKSDFAEQVADTIYGKSMSFKRLLFCSKDALVTYDRIKWSTMGLFILVIPVMLFFANFRIAEEFHFVAISQIIGFGLFAYFEFVLVRTASEVSQKQQKWYQTWKKASQEAESKSQVITSLLAEYGLKTTDFQLATPCIKHELEGECTRRIIIHFPSLKMDTWAVVATVA